MQIRPTQQVIFRPSRKRERIWQRTHYLSSRLNPLRREGPIVNRAIRRILDRAPRQPRPSRKPHRLRHDLRLIPKPILEIRADRQLRRRNNLACMSQSLLASSRIIPLPARKSRARARSSQRLRTPAPPASEPSPDPKDSESKTHDPAHAASEILQLFRVVSSLTLHRNVSPRRTLYAGNVHHQAKISVRSIARNLEIYLIQSRTRRSRSYIENIGSVYRGSIQ